MRLGNPQLGNSKCFNYRFLHATSMFYNGVFLNECKNFKIYNNESKKVSVCLVRMPLFEFR